jgi:hypothetical protein
VDYRKNPDAAPDMAPMGSRSEDPRTTIGRRGTWMKRPSQHHSAADRRTGRGHPAAGPHPLSTRYSSRMVTSRGTSALVRMAQRRRSRVSGYLGLRDRGRWRSFAALRPSRSLAPIGWPLPCWAQRDSKWRPTGRAYRSRHRRHRRSKSHPNAGSQHASLWSDGSLHYLRSSICDLALRSSPVDALPTSAFAMTSRMVSSFPWINAFSSVVRTMGPFTFSHSSASNSSV